MTARVTIIAEVGVNHNGDPEVARRMVEAAWRAGADAVKFQTFKADRLVLAAAPKAPYQERTTDPGESQREMLRKLELAEEDHRRLQDFCREIGIDFLSSPFDEVSLTFLVEELNLSTLKLPSGEITNAPLLVAAGRSGKKILLSTGMATLGEIEKALEMLAVGMVFQGTARALQEVLRDVSPGGRASRVFIDFPTAREFLAERVILLQCTTEYPAPYRTANLRAMETLRSAFGLAVGFSDHTPGIAVALAAVARGAVVVEKHFTLDRRLPGPDHAASLEPEAFRELVEGIRAVEASLGDGRKGPVAEEWANRLVARKSLVTLAGVAQGELFTEANLGTRRPGGGLSPMAYWDWLGRRAERDYPVGALVGVTPDPP
ncbi:MAG: N-acetylneuraminate synthase [Magnetococcales bacterium]|nr:N-acetylneuraminate synthase [Magnetococcales bacterium]